MKSIVYIFFVLCVGIHSAHAINVKVSPGLATELMDSCSGPSSELVSASEQYCRTLTSVPGRVGNIIGRVGNLVARQSQLTPQKLASTGLTSFGNCVAKNPLLNALAQATGLLGDLVPDINQAKKNIPVCGVNALNSVLDGVFGDLANQVGNLGNCVGNAFGNVTNLLNQSVALMGQIQGFFNNYANTLNDKITRALTQCGAAGVNELFRDCIKVGSGITKPFEYVEKLSNVKLDPKALMSEAIGCAGTASNLGLPIASLANLIAEVYRTVQSLKNISIDIPLDIGGAGTDGPGLCAQVLSQVRNTRIRCNKVKTAVRKARASSRR